jgi:galactokinase
MNLRKLKGILSELPEGSPLAIHHDKLSPSKVGLLRKALEVLESQSSPSDDEPTHICYVPGRIEILGKHTDYGGGPTMVMALDRGFVIVSCRNGTDRINVWNAHSSFEPCSFALKSDVEPLDGWATYPATAAWRIAFNFGQDVDLKGVDIGIASDLLPAGGMSSSSALIIGSFFAIAGPNDLHKTELYHANIHNRIDLAMYLAVVENGLSFRDLPGHRGVGTFGGSEDHTAILCCEEESFSVNYYCPTVPECNVAFPEEWVLAVCHSGKHAVKTAEAMEEYNAVSLRLGRVLSTFNKAEGTEFQTMRAVVNHLSDSATGEVNYEKIRNSLNLVDVSVAEDLFERFEQFSIEMTEIIPEAVDALETKDADRLGNCIDRSHTLSKSHLRNIVNEVDCLQSIAREEGAIAASGFGAGFGGSVYAIVRREEANVFLQRWIARYSDACPDYSEQSSAFLTTPAGPAFCSSFE